MSFKHRDELGDKIDKLTVVMSKLAAKDNHERKHFKPQIYKSRGQRRSYGQGCYQARSDNGNRGYIVNNSSRQKYRSNRFRGNFRGYSRQNNRDNYRNERYGSNIEIGVSQGKELLQGVMVMEEIEALAMIGLDHGPELVEIGIE